MGEQNSWWQKNPAELDRFKRELEEFDSLKFEIKDSQIFIHGDWSVFGKDLFITKYEIRIELPNDFPLSVPKVFEAGNRILKNPEFHFNPSDQSACLFAQPERYEKWPIGSGIRDFLNGPVKEFFFSQAYRELKGTWPFGEWSHEGKGIIEYYASRLGTSYLNEIGEMLKLALQPKLYRQWKCPCSLKKRVTTCHGEKIKFLTKTLPEKEIKNAISLIQNEIKNGRAKVEEIK